MSESEQRRESTTPAGFPWESAVTRRVFLHRSAALGGSLSLAGLLAACGGDEEAGPAGGTGPSAGKDTITVAHFSDMQNLDPHTSSADTATQEVLTNIYDVWLTYQVPGTEQDGVDWANVNEFMPWAAESWEYNADKTELTFTLRDDLKFADGSPLTAEAVKFTTDRMFDIQAVASFLFAIVGITKKNQLEVVDKRRFKLILPAPVGEPLLLGNMAMFFSTGIVNPAVVKEHATESDPTAQEWLKTHTADSGPYLLKEWNVGSGWTLEANPHHWKPPKTTRIVFRIVPDAQQRELLVRSGEVDIALGLPIKDVEALREDPNLNVISVPSRKVAWAGFDVTAPPFDNKLVRQAISYAVPYDTIMQEVLRGQGVQLKSPSPEGTPTSDFSFWKYDTNPEKARELLSQAGLADGFNTELAVPIGNPIDEETAVWIQQGLQEVGIRVSINKMPSAAFTSALQGLKHKFWFSSDAWISINNDPFYHLFWLFAADCCTYGKYQNPRVVDLVNTWMTKPADDPGRIEASKEAQRIIVEDAPWIFLYQPPQIYVLRKEIRGFTYYSSDNYVRYFPLTKV
jgi:peptide/nickel transport system substrate-binding protein